MSDVILDDGDVVVRRKKLTGFKQDQHNANKHSENGRRMLKQSVTDRKFGRPMFAANDGTMLGGNLTLDVVQEIGADEAIVVETKGNTPIIHVRTDLESGSADAITLAIEDNRIAQVSLTWDDAELIKAKEAGVDIGRLFGEEDAVTIKQNKTDEGLEVRFGNYRIPATEDEISSLSSLLEDYIKETGVSYGFVNWLFSNHV